jgi:hypothetical protein
MRRIVRAAHIGEKLGDILTFENPASIEEIQADGQRGLIRFLRKLSLTGRAWLSLASWRLR